MALSCVALFSLADSSLRIPTYLYFSLTPLWVLAIALATQYERISTPYLMRYHSSQRISNTCMFRQSNQQISRATFRKLTCSKLFNTNLGIICAKSHDSSLILNCMIIFQFIISHGFTLQSMWKLVVAQMFHLYAAHQ